MELIFIIFSEMACMFLDLLTEENNKLEAERALIAQLHQLTAADVSFISLL